MQHNSDGISPYKILKVDEAAPFEVIKAAYRALLKSENLHPDLGGKEEAARAVIQAYEVLSDPLRRKELDEQLRKAKTAEMFRRFDAEAGDRRNTRGPQPGPARSARDPKEFFVICLRCRGINRLTEAQSVFYTRCGGCKLPFMTEAAGGFRPNEPPPKKPPKNDPNLAKYMYDRKMFVRALEDYTKLIETDPKNSSYRYMAGMCSYRMLNYRQALKHFNDAHAINADSFMCNLYTAKALLKMENPTDAVPYLEKAIHLNRHHIKARVLLGQTLFHSGRFEKAIPHLIHVVKTKPTADNVVFLLGMAYHHLHKPFQARIYFKIAKRLFPKNTKIDPMIDKMNNLINNTGIAV